MRTVPMACRSMASPLRRSSRRRPLCPIPTGFFVCQEVIPEVVIMNPVLGDIQDLRGETSGTEENCARSQRANDGVTRWKLKGPPFLAREVPKQGAFLWAKSVEGLFGFLASSGAIISLPQFPLGNLQESREDEHSQCREREHKQHPPEATVQIHEVPQRVRPGQEQRKGAATSEERGNLPALVHE